MDIRSTLISTLALLTPLATTGCPSTYGCDPPSEKFTLDESVSAADVQSMIDRGYSAPIECQAACSFMYNRRRGWQTSGASSCTFTAPTDTTDGHVTCAGTGYEYFCEGRRPLGHEEAGDDDCADSLGRNLAAMAYLEAASVIAFEQLASWLENRNAPRRLVERCLDAADDERHHALWLGKMAAERGATVPTLAPLANDDEASEFEVALHNAVEGCVHESFAALMAAVRAERSGDCRLRQVFAKIAADEARHGQLAWDLDSWLAQRLDPTELEQVHERRADALAKLADRAKNMQSSMPKELTCVDADEAALLASAFAARLAA